MELRPLGRTGLRVSRLCLGGAMFGSWGGDEADAIRIVHDALDAGINLIDTADAYSAGESEEIIGRALFGQRRDGIVLATKFHNPMGNDQNRRGNSRRWIVKALDESLRRFGTDWIDLYQAHRFDADCDLDETIDVLTDLVRDGKIRYFGSSNFPASAIVEAQWASTRRGRARFVSDQPPYSILARSIETDVLPVCAEHGLGVISWSPLSGGWLSGRYGPGGEESPDSSARAWITPKRYDMSLEANHAKLEAVGRLQELAGEAGLTLMELAMGFALEHPAITAVIAGPRSPGQLAGYLSASTVRLDADVLDGIDAIVAPGTTLNVADQVWQSPAVIDPLLRRNRVGNSRLI